MNKLEEFKGELSEIKEEFKERWEEKMKKTVGVSATDNRVVVTPLEFQKIDEELLRKYLSPEAATIVFNPVYNTIVEEVKTNWIKSMVGTMYPDRYGYLVQFMSVRGEGDITEERIMRFCYIINHIVQWGDFVIGSLCSPFKVDMVDGSWAISFYAASPTAFSVLKEKYGELFCHEGRFPLFHIDDLGHKEWEAYEKNRQEAISNFPYDAPQMVKEVMVDWLAMKERESKEQTK